ncbi:type I restriction enzyme HsdR N-terminal domain-containing protein [Desulfosarcina sp. OttesenSCG-928-A07]|nr:type I restriction enzyme HsdR N-terminal domain-containing protein [Desulfosarcina sp. OttesenSCG-928-G17]MDL2328395.1 type I restriction enzyme HsdR N-terminal domain-containing protein [Desulfosarcina sp. OttesenSCG-928-A07]
MNEMIIDYITGKAVPHIGAEANRQKVERYLVEEKGYLRNEVWVDMPISVEINGEIYASAVDLVIQIAGQPLIAVKCAAGSIGSREREIISAARLLAPTPLPLAVVSDGADAIVLDVLTRKKTGQGLAAIPHRRDIIALSQHMRPAPLSVDRLEMEKRVFRSYDTMNVNVARKDA